jgi:ABC-type transporter Mla subunit MlaD
MYQSQARNTAEGQESNIPLLLVVRQAVAEKSDTTLSSNFQKVAGKTEQFRTIWTELAAVSEQLSSCSELFGTTVRNCSDFPGTSNRFQCGCVAVFANE